MKKKRKRRKRRRRKRKEKEKKKKRKKTKQKRRRRRRRTRTGRRSTKIERRTKNDTEKEVAPRSCAVAHELHSRQRFRG